MCVTLYNHLLGTLYCCWWSHVASNQLSKVCDIVQSSAWDLVLQLVVAVTPGDGMLLHTSKSICDIVQSSNTIIYQLVDCMSLHSSKASLQAKVLKFVIILFFFSYWDEEGVKILLKEKARRTQRNVLRFSDCCKTSNSSRHTAASFFNSLLGEFVLFILYKPFK